MTIDDSSRDPRPGTTAGSPPAQPAPPGSDRHPSQASGPDVPSSGSADTRPLGTTPSPTHPSGTQSAGSTSGSTAAGNTRAAAAPTPSTGDPTPPQPAASSTPPIRTGTNWTAVIVGVFSLLAAGLIVLREQIDWHIDWQRFGPGTLVGLGILLVILGSLGLTKRQKQG